MFGLYEQHVGTAYHFVKFSHPYFGKCLANLLRKEFEEVYNVLGTSHKPLSKLLVLGGNAHRTGVEMAFAHHHASKHYKCACGETVLFGSEHSHDNHITRGLKLTVGLQFHLTAQIVDDKRLLGFGESYFHRKSGIVDGACG